MRRGADLYSLGVLVWVLLTGGLLNKALLWDVTAQKPVVSSSVWELLKAE